MRVWVTAGATTLSVLVLLASCREPTELTLELSTDLSCGELGDTSIYVGTAAELAGPLSRLTPAAVTHGCMAGKEGRIGSIVVLPSGSDDERISLRIVAGRNGADCAANLQSGCIESRRSLGFVAHTPLYLPVELAKSCENVVCANASDTCAGGQCVPGDVVCNGGCSTPGTDAGLVDATPLKDVIGVKDVISVLDLGLDDAPIFLDVNVVCLPPALDAGGALPSYTWHFDEGSGTTTSEAFGALPAASLPSGASFVSGPSSTCKTALALKAGGLVLGTSAPLGGTTPRVDFWMKTQIATGAILSTQDSNSLGALWSLYVENGNLGANLCGASQCLPLTTAAAVADGAWHRVTFVHTLFPNLAVLAVDGVIVAQNTMLLKSAASATLTVGLSGTIDELLVGGN